AAPPGVKAGSVVRSGGLTPALSHTESGATKKKPNTFPFFFLHGVFLKTKKTKNNTNRTTISDHFIIKNKYPTIKKL
ncbi:hypothetical protein ACVGXT_26200, partial [Enterobacter intestinihominis]